MSPLWENNETKIKQLKTFHKRPSPKHNSDYQIFAQKISIINILRDFIEGISLFASKSHYMEASMTVEAAVVLPLFLFFFLNLGSAIEMIRLHGNMEFALYDIGNRMAVYGYALTTPEKELKEEDESGLLEELQDIAFSYTYVKNEIVEYLGSEYLKTSPIADGIDGMHFLESEIFDEEDCIEIIVTYKVAPGSSVVGFKSFRMANRYYGHLWNGYHIPGTEDYNMQENVVYVTENGSVYHENRECSHLMLSVREVSLQEAYISRNSKGEKYEPCARCGDEGVIDKVYITDDGDNIHFKSDCAGLKRTIHKMYGDGLKDYRPCTRCIQD